MDDLVEILRQPILVFGQRSETFFCLLEFADFTGDVSALERFGGFRRFLAKLFCREHAVLPVRQAQSGSSLHGVIRLFFVLGVVDRIWGRSGRSATFIARFEDPEG